MLCREQQYFTFNSLKNALLMTETGGSLELLMDELMKRYEKMRI